MMTKREVFTSPRTLPTHRTEYSNAYLLKSRGIDWENGGSLTALPRMESITAFASRSVYINHQLTML